MKPGLINVVFNFPALLERQLPVNFFGLNEGWRFSYNLSGKCDYLVVFDDLPRACQFDVSSGVRILICTEPSTVRVYGPQFLSQFTHVICTQEGVRANKDIALKNFYVPIPWHIGWNHDDGNLMSYQDLNSSFQNLKTKKLSIVCSPKTHTAGHRDRLNFVKYFSRKSRFKPDVYGLDKPFSDKFVGLSAYQFTLVIENTKEPYYWTEKLADAFISEAFPLYYGDPKIKNFFDPKSFYEIDSISGDIDKTIELVDDFLESADYNDLHKDLLESKNIVMTKFSFHAYITSIIGDLTAHTSFRGNKFLIVPERYCLSDKLKFYRRKLWNMMF